MPAKISATRKEAITRIRTALIEKKMTQAELADASDCHEKTIQNMLGGRSVRDQTLFDVCMVLDLPFDEIKAQWTGEQNYYDVPTDSPEQPAPGSDVAPVYMGAYTKAGVDQMVGSYLTLRPAFSVPDMIIAYRTDVEWDDTWPSLVFQESQRPDAAYSHRGRLHIPAASMFVHFVSLSKGSMRMIIVSQLNQLDEMRGLITTVSRNGAVVLPVSAPMVYIKREPFGEPALGQIERNHESYEQYRELLDTTVADGYGRLVG